MCLLFFLSFFHVDAHTRVLPGGDCFSPSKLSVIDKGKHMVQFFNQFGVDCSVVGNHDLDFGEGTLAKYIKASNSRWLLSNIDNAVTGAPLGDASRSALLECGGVRVGVFGLGEEEWLSAVQQLPPVKYHDMVATGDALSRELREKGADVVVALLHCRVVKFAFDFDFFLKKIEFEFSY